MTLRCVGLLILALALGPSACHEGAASHRHQEPRFLVEATISGGTLDVFVEPRSPYKLAIEFPFELRVGGDEAVRHDAEAASERSEQRLHYVVPAPETADAQLIFGICRGDDSICERVEHPFVVSGS